MVSKAELLEIGQRFQNKFHKKDADEAMPNWQKMPVQITDGGLVVVVDYYLNQKADQLISENFKLQFSNCEGRFYFHLWNQWGIISPRPLEFILPECVTLEGFAAAKKAVPAAKKPMRVSCTLLVQKDGVIVSMKLFSLNEDISEHLLHMVLTQNAETRITNIELVQDVIAEKIGL